MSLNILWRMYVECRASYHAGIRFCIFHHNVGIPAGYVVPYRGYHYCVFGHFQSSCFYLKQRFRNWILSPSSGGIYSVGPSR
jgi:hypothetical protein